MSYPTCEGKITSKGLTEFSKTNGQCSKRCKPDHWVKGQTEVIFKCTYVDCMCSINNVGKLQMRERCYNGPLTRQAVIPDLYGRSK